MANSSAENMIEYLVYQIIFLDTCQKDNEDITEGQGYDHINDSKNDAEVQRILQCSGSQSTSVGGEWRYYSIVGAVLQNNNCEKSYCG